MEDVVDPGFVDLPVMEDQSVEIGFGQLVHPFLPSLSLAIVNEVQRRA